MKILISFISVAFLFLTSCSSTKPAETSSKAEAKSKTEEVVVTTTDAPKVAEKFSIDGEDELVVSFQQTACFGQCPVHTMEIYSSGKAVYKGDRWVHNVGDYYAILTKSEVTAIFDKAEALSFFDLDASYKANMTDLPTTYIMINSGMRTHTLSAYGEYPDNLKLMIEYLTGLTESISWKQK